MKGIINYGMMGSGHFASLCLRGLVAEKIPPAWLVTAPPRPAGRGLQYRKTAAQTAAEELEIPAFCSGSISEDSALLAPLLSEKPAFILVVDFAQLIKGTLLHHPPQGCLNIHPSLLPEYRGAAPLQRAIMDGKKESGVSVFQLVERMDAGPILAQEKLPIQPEDTYGSLLEKAAALGVSLLAHQMRDTPVDEWHYSPQGEEPLSYASKIGAPERAICWKMDGRVALNRVRALTPDPGAYVLCSGKRVGIKKAHFLPEIQAEPGTVVGLQNDFPIIACCSGALVLQEVQPEGKRLQGGDAWFRGARLSVGERVGE